MTESVDSAAADESPNDIEIPSAPPKVAPLAMRTARRLDDFFQVRPVMPVIENPVLPGEHFNRH